MRTLPLRRWTINLLSGLSLLIFLLAMGTWVRSYFGADFIRRTDTWGTESKDDTYKCRRYAFLSGRGLIMLTRVIADTKREEPPSPPVGWDYLQSRPRGSLLGQTSSEDRTNLRLVQFQLLTRAGGNSVATWKQQSIIFPLWLFLLFAIPPLL